MPFFGPGGLGGYSPSTTESGLDPQFIQQLITQFPGLQQMTGQDQQGPRTLASLGYQGQGPQLFQGQGTSAFNLSPFEGVSGVSPESVTAGLAQGTFGKSASQSPVGGGPVAQQASSLLSLPTLQLPMAQVAASQGGFGAGDISGGPPVGAQQDGGITIGAGDVIGGAQKAIDLFAPGTGTAFDPTGQTQTPAYQGYRAGERDLSTLGGSFLSQVPFGPASIESFSFGAMPPSEPMTATTFSASGEPITVGTLGDLGFDFDDSSPTSFAPGGSAQTALSPQLPEADFLGGGLSTLQGLYSLYGGAQSGDIGQLLGGASGTLGGLSQMAPETIAALSQQLGLGAGGLGLVGSGLGGLGGAFGLYQGIEQGDPLQALMGAGGLYAGAAPLVNAAFGTALPTLSSLGAQALTAIAPQLAAQLGITAGATAGATGGAAAGSAAAGAAAGAAGAGAALPLGMVAGPYLVGKLFELGVELTEGKEQAARTGKQFSNLMSQLPGQLNAFGATPSQLAQLGPDTTPEQAAAMFEQLLGAQRAFDESGVQNFLRSGQTASSYGDFAKGVSAKFPESQEILRNLTPFLGSTALATIRAQDIAQRGGAQLSRPFSAQEAALMLGSTPVSSSEAGSPGAWGASPNAYLQANYYDTATQQRAAYQQQVNAYLDNLQQQREAIGEGHRGDVRNDPEVMAQVATLFGSPDTIGQYGWSPTAQQALAQIQPGYLEQGLSQLFGGQFASSVQPWLDIQQQVQQAQAQDPVTQQLQQFTSQLGGLTQQAPDILQAAQTSLQGAPVPTMAGVPSVGGGGMDLERILRELGYLR